MKLIKLKVSSKIEISFCHCIILDVAADYLLQFKENAMIFHMIMHKMLLEYIQQVFDAKRNCKITLEILSKYRSCSFIL